MYERLRENWVRPALFFGNNPLSLFGGAITTASGVTMITYWWIELISHVKISPYIGIIFFLILPALFILGLILIPIGIFIRRRKLLKAGQIPAIYPKVDLNDRVFRRGIDIVLIFTVINMLVVSIASYRGAAYMDSPEFCGASCHVMHPEYAAYQVSAHAHVACVDCHIGSGAASYFQAKVNGTKQLIEVTLRPIAGSAPKLIPTYPTPIPSPVHNLRPARYICEECHTPAKFIGEKMLVKSNFADDEKNTETQSVVVLHLGGRDSLSHLSGIHGVHLGHIEYVDTDESRTTIPWVEKFNADGSKTVYASSSSNGVMPQGERRTMDCIDCHNRAAHTMQTAEDALNRAMNEHAVSPALPHLNRHIKRRGAPTRMPLHDDARFDSSSFLLNSDVRQHLGLGFVHSQQVVASRTVIRDLLPARLIRVVTVVASEASRVAHVPNMVRMRSPGHLHLGKHVVRIDIDQFVGRNLYDIRLSRIHVRISRLVVVHQLCGNLLLCFVGRFVISLQQFQRLLLVNAVATRAAYARLRMRRTLEVRVLARMTSQAGLVHFLRRVLVRIEDLRHIAAAVHVGLARSVAALAACAVLAVHLRNLRMRIVRESLRHILMTGCTCLGSDIVGGRRLGSLRALRIRCRPYHRTARKQYNCEHQS
jgi:nitrate/TMAO reductase-like tetraheme cytochrome c subunit